MFLRLGQDERYKMQLEQLKKQREAVATAASENAKKLKAAYEKKTFKINFEFKDKHLQSALAKLTEVSTYYDRSRGLGKGP